MQTKGIATSRRNESSIMRNLWTRNVREIALEIFFLFRLKVIKNTKRKTRWKEG